MFEVSREMPRYQCHKKVHALKIVGIGVHADGSATITPEEEGFASFVVRADYMNKHSPKVGGYYVVYEDDYKSFSPAKAFEEGYTLEKNETAGDKAERLLLSLLTLMGTQDGPKKTTYVMPVLECVVGIGNDHTASICIHQEDLDALRERVQVESGDGDSPAIEDGAASILIALDQGCIRVTHGESGTVLAELGNAPMGSWDKLWACFDAMGFDDMRAGLEGDGEH